MDYSLRDKALQVDWMSQFDVFKKQSVEGVLFYMSCIENWVTSFVGC